MQSRNLSTLPTFTALQLMPEVFQAWRMYAETISGANPKFYGLRCDSAEEFDSGLCCAKKELQVGLMGENSPNTTKGTFYLVTNRGAPHVKPLKESVQCQWVPEQ